MSEPMSSRLRVLFVGHEASRTGAPVGFLSLMKWWRETGQVEPLVWLRRGGPLEQAHYELGPLAVGTDAGGLAAKLGGGVHLAYLNTATLGGFAEELHAAGVPVVCHAHEMDHELERTGRDNLKRLRRCVTFFVACSEAVRESLQRCAGIEPGRIAVVPECVDVERALRLAREGTAARVRQQGRRLVCGMGTVGWRKGTDLFLRVAAELGDEWSGVWIGDLEGSPEADRLRHDLRILGLEGRVAFTGSLANPFAVLRQADVFCLTSREDPYPLAMVEAAALGLPVIGFRGSGGVVEFAEAGGALLADYVDTAGMAALARGARRPENGEGLARQLCAPEVVGARLIEIMSQTALPAPAAVKEGTVERLARAAAEAVKVEVVCTHEASGQTSGLTWEGAAGEVTEVELEQDLKPGRYEVAFHPRSRSVIVSKVEVIEAAGDGARRLVNTKTRSAGRAVRLGKDDGGTWLLLDGQGRLVLRTQEDVEGRLLLRWHLRTAIKPELEARLERCPPGRAFLDRLGLKKPAD